MAGRSGEYVQRLEAELRVARARLEATNEALESSRRELLAVNAELARRNSEQTGSGAAGAGVAGAVANVQDIGARKEAQERQRLLMAELQHRVRNILGVVRAVARRTARTSESVEDYAMHLDGRLSALARTQAILNRSPGQGVDLEGLIADELLAAGGDEQVAVDGPEVRLRAEAAETLSLAVHELATNAVKYGALSADRGRVSVTWRVDQLQSSTPSLKLEWQEFGVSIVATAPRRRGFGLELIERTVPYELGASAEVEFAPGGFRCAIAMPLNQRNVILPLCAEVEDRRAADA